VTAHASSPADEAPTRRVTPTRLVLLLVVLALAGIWVYILYLAFGPGRQPPIDRLTDPAFAPAAQARCSQALDEVALLPDATEVPDADARADVIEEANAIFDAMLTDLVALAPEGEEGGMVTAWVADWRTYLDDRQAYADALRDDPDARFLVSAKDNEQITEYIDGFAADNQMPSCGTPLDV
jgi:hypothetical protein